MTREELKTNLRNIETAYPNRITITQETFDVWFEMLGDLDGKVVSQVVAKIIKTSHYPPTIADIRAGCEEHNSEIARKTAEAKNVFYDALTYFYDPNKDKKKLWNLFCEGIKKFPAEIRMKKIYEFRERVRETENLPTIEEFISEFTR